MEYHSVLKMKEILKYAPTWMNLGDISEINESQKRQILCNSMYMEYLE